MAITTFDSLVNAMSSGQNWRSDWQKTYTGGTVVAGRWYDLSYSGGQPSIYIHGNLVSNYDFLAGASNWTFSSGFTWTQATHLMTKSNSGSVETLQQDVDLVWGAAYEVIYTLGSYAGSGNVSVSLAGGTAVTHAANNTYTDTVTAGSSNNTLLFSVATTVTALTIDVVYVRRLLNFTPYDSTIARNGAGQDLACYTGGAVASNTKVLANMGTWTNVAAGAPSVLMLVDMLGCYPKIVTNSSSAQPLYQNDHVTNGTFTGNANSWTLGSGWSYNSNAVDHGAGVGTLSQTTTFAAQANRNYLVSYQITNYTVSGTLTIGFGGGTATTRTISGNGTYVDFVTATGTGDLIITPTTALRCTIDNVICGFAPPRYGTGSGVMTYFAINTTNGANAQNFALTYVNTAGTTGRGLGATVANTASAIQQHISHSGVSAGNFGPFLPLAPGDSGIACATSSQFSAASASAGFIDLVLCRPIAAIPITAAFYAAERDLLNQLPSLPQIKDGACLSFIIFAGAVIPNPCMYQGYLTTPWG
jgi:hypothetical protein